MKRNRVLSIFFLSGLAFASLFSCSSNQDSSLVEGYTSIEIQGPDYLNVGSSSSFQAIVCGPDSKVAWSVKSSQSDIASIDSDGKVTGLAPGFATIYASSENNNASGHKAQASYTLFVAPAYLDEVHSAYSALSLSSGVGFDTSVQFSTFAVKGSLNITSDFKGSLSSLSKGNFDDSFYLDGTFSSSFMDTQADYSYSYLGEGNLAYYAKDENDSNAINSFDLISLESIYASLSSVFSNASSSISSYLPSLFSLLFQTASLNEDTGTFLNSFLTISNNASKGLYLSTDGIGFLNDLYQGGTYFPTGLREAIITASGNNSVLLDALLPESIAQICFKPLFKDDGSFDSISLIFSAVDLNKLSPAYGTKTPFLTLSSAINTSRDLSEDTFKNERKTGLSGKADFERQEELKESKKAIQEIIQAQGGSLYNAFNFYSEFSQMLEEYILAVRKRTEEATYKSLFEAYSQDISSYDSLLTFQARTSEALLTSGLYLKAGMQISFSSISLFNSSSALPSFSLTADSLSSYITISQDTYSLTINKNTPTGDQKCVLTLQADGYKSLEFVIYI